MYEFICINEVVVGYSPAGCVRDVLLSEVDKLSWDLTEIQNLVELCSINNLNESQRLSLKGKSICV